MSKTIFTKVDYPLEALINNISLGEIGLPSIQRPFVWKNTKVRDLFDSMYRGYPVGYLLFWKTGGTNTSAVSPTTIGGKKQKTPQLLIVDGQQRLTALYAVVRDIAVLRTNYQHEKIHIAFNPVIEKFEVTSAAILNDKSYIAHISVLWNPDYNIFDIVKDYLDGLKNTREVSHDEEKLIQNRILQVKDLASFSFIALELASDIDEEAVAEVFVRINSKGTTLNQTDFILTLMSVFWDEGRTQLETFCRNSRRPSKDNATPFNYYIDPTPDQMLRVGIGVTFKRARMQHVYSILRGKNMETRQFSDEYRIKQFDLLKASQPVVLNVQNWHEFLKCLSLAGFKSSKMISSENNLLYSYMFYLLGKTEYGIKEHDLKLVIARWFFMSAVTGRYTGSPETAVEADIALFRDITSADCFMDVMKQQCQIALTKDFWKVTLPNNLATTAVISPSLNAYHAALVLHNAKVLFSHNTVHTLLDPAMKANKSALERHHLFPKNHLVKRGIKDQMDINQIANYALVEWSDNISISDKAPAQYLPDMKSRFNEDELAQMYSWHALPDGWEHMDYHEFLHKRRVMMADITQQGYMLLSSMK